MGHLALYFFGPPRIELDNEPIKLGRHKAIALLAYLAVTQETHSRNTPATLLWPDFNQSRARAALRRVLATLNNAGLTPWLNADRETLGLKITPTLWVDVMQFHQNLATCLAAGQQSDSICLPLLTEAVNLYQADFLDGFTLRDSPDFDQWQFTQAENLRHDLTSALARLIRCHTNRSQLEPAIAYARYWIEIDPLYELAHRQLMQLYAWNNQRTAALRQYQECVQILKQELNVPPAEETTALYRQILAEDFQPQRNLPQNPLPAPQQFPTLAPPKSALHNFPAQPTPFIGRQAALRELVKRLQNPNCQLLTLTGPGGIGKTRLAIQTAIELGTTFADGLYFVPLGPVGAADFFIGAITDTLQRSLDGQEEARPQLLNYLRQKEMLLVLDNFEHLTDQTDLLLEILHQAPGVKLLVTSRERLQLQEEWVFELKGMSYPNGPQPEEIESYSAVALFLHRAYRVDSDFALTEAEQPHVIRICQLVEGIPLAVELAATWVRVLSCAEIAAEIERMFTTQNNLDFLATPLQDVPKRHQSLRLVFEHSWQLLSATEQQALRQLSVFRGGCTREAVASVTGADLLLVSALVDKSVLMRGGPNRYEMHELLRQFAAEKLRQHPKEASAVQRRHGQYYLTFLHRQEQPLKGAAQQETLAEIAKEIENVRAGWHWAVTTKNLAEIKKGMESLWHFYALYGWFQEGVDSFAQAVAKLQGVDPNPETQTVGGQALVFQGWFLLRQGQYRQAQAVLQESVDIFDSLDAHPYRATSLHFLGILAGEIGQVDQARQLLQQGLAIYRQANNPWATAWCLSNLAYHMGQQPDESPTEAQQLLQESLAIYKRLGNKQGIAVALNNLGYITYLQGDYATAKTLLEECLALRREIGYPRGIALTQNHLGHVNSALGNSKAGQSCYRQALKIAADIQTIPLILAALEGLAETLARQKQPMQALKVLNFVLGHPASNNETRGRAKKGLAQLTTQLPPEVVVNTHLQANGHLQQLETLVAQLLSETAPEERS